jgi:membrane protein DedA with SNARE-associated domain
LNPTIPEWLEPFVLFLKSHTLLVPFTIWLGAFIESFAFVGILTPGTLILPALGFVAGTLNQPMLVTFFACYLGAVIGDTSSYFLGRYCKDPILNIPQVQQYHPLILQAEKHFQRFGALSLAIGRFIGPLRPILPFFAGSLKMSFRLFLGLNLLTAILWAVLYCMLGYYAGIATLEVIQ